MNESTQSEPGRELLRHTVATLAYRGGKAISNAPEGFEDFRASGETRATLPVAARSPGTPVPVSAQPLALPRPNSRPP